MIPETSDSFVRQRRNLFIATISLFFLTITDSKLEQINILGNKIEIGSHQDAMLFLWIVFFYLLWRYYTVFRETNTGFWSKFHEIKMKYVTKEAEKRMGSQDQIDKFFDYHTRNVPDGTIVEKEFIDVFNIGCLKFNNGGQHEFSGILRGKIKIAGVKTGGQQEIRITLSNKDFLLLDVANFLYVVCCTNRFGEFYLPLFMAGGLIGYEILLT